MQLVAVHGYPVDRRVWGPLQSLAKKKGLGRDLNVFAPDLRGRGSSRRPAEEKHAMSLLADDLAEDITVLLPDNEKFLLAGASAGGYVAFEFLKRHRARFRDRLAGLVLIATRASADSEPERTERRNLAAVIRSEGVQAALDALMPDLLGRSAEDTPVEELARVMVGATPPATAIADLLGIAERDDGFAPLAAFARPVLIVAGEDDRVMSPSDAEALRDAAAGSPDVRLVTIPGAGHLAPLEKPREVGEAIADLLKRLR